MSNLGAVFLPRLSGLSHYLVFSIMRMQGQYSFRRILHTHLHRHLIRYLIRSIKKMNFSGSTITVTRVYCLLVCFHFLPSSYRFVLLPSHDLDLHFLEKEREVLRIIFSFLCEFINSACIMKWEFLFKCQPYTMK